MKRTDIFAIPILPFLAATSCLSADKQPEIHVPKSGEKAACELCKDIPSLFAGITETKWIPVAERQPQAAASFEMTNQAGQKVSLGRLAGKPMAITFLYTRCENPNKCPLAARTMANLQSEIQKAGLSDQVQLAVMTYDPEFDTTEALRKYAESKGIYCNANVMMLRPEPETKLKLFESMNVSVNYDANRVNIHGLQLLLLDKAGRFVRNYQTLIWDNQKVVADLKKLLSETN